MSRLAWVTTGTAWAAAVAWVILLVVNRETVQGPGALVDIASIAGFIVVWPLAGLLLARRRPSLPTGWLFLIAGTIVAVDAAVGEVLTLRVASGATPPPGATYLATGLRQMSFVPIIVLLALYPDGRPLSPRWRWTVWSPLLAVPVLLVPLQGDADQLMTYRGQPTGVTGLSGGVEPLLWGIGALLTYPALLGAAVSIVLRFRRSRGVTRLQLKWAAYAGLAALLVLGVSVLEVPYVDDLHHLAGVVLVYGFPACVVVAVLQHRLYDIDRLVSRTLSYATVTVVLAVVYAAGVLGVGALVPGEPSDLVVAGSTLAVAALFRPVRSRVQTIVDRRFSRARYDAQQVVAGFAGQLRSEVDLHSLSEQLGRTVDRVVQPRSVSIVLVQHEPTL